ncbi:ATP-dependent endonuclease [Microvirga sp. 17 mud 1-3]|uniref:ATP-dependent nuclease n=1 Tax=Microvirga sp. 17 mud 1-3 TaxID=2082949 RepID=UPI000D6CD48C|nr:AAA family ATPase [Microvirga sp. 17 mud 1-3]AWM86847.1 hypothetical protein C4E04_09000 [Microvirga sp. 17 mud 1-3]
MQQKAPAARGRNKASPSGVTTPSLPERPHARLKEIQFSDGTIMGLTPGEIIVFVGPNNAGKSAALKEIYGRLAHGQNFPTRVTTRVEFESSETGQEVEEWLARTARRDHLGNYIVSMVGTIHRGIVAINWDHRNLNGIQSLANTMILHLGTEARLSAVNPVDLVNLVTEVITHPLHRLYDDDELEERLDRIFFRAFRQNLIVNRGAGRQVMLHSGKRPKLPKGKDRQSNDFRTAVNQLPAVNDQGDGIRAFVGILASVLAADRDIILIDEPEAFLHPPQATTLGRVLAEETPTDRQLLVATHSTDFLRGMLDHSSPRVRVVRIQRAGDVNYIRELSPTTVRNVWADPLLRYSKVLDGLFHDAVLVCEGDADCRFYGAMLDAISANNSGPDIALVYGAGKSRIATIVQALKAIGVPVRVVVDFDILADEAGLRNLVESLGVNGPKSKRIGIQLGLQLSNEGLESLRQKLAMKSWEFLIKLKPLHSLKET